MDVVSVEKADDLCRVPAQDPDRVDGAWVRSRYEAEVSLSFSEDGSSDANDCGPFFDGHLEITGHSHG